MSTSKHIFRTTAFVVLAIAALALIIGYAVGSGTPPKEFLEARIHAVGASNNLANLVNNSLSNLAKVDQFEHDGRDSQALELIGYEANQKAEKQNSAVLLATYLNQMAKAVPDIDSETARSQAMSAITSGVAMVSRIISYNENLDKLFSTLQQKILLGVAPDTTTVSTLAANLNSDAQAINTLSKDFNAALSQFDSAYGISN